jgi:hypothetical protein
MIFYLVTSQHHHTIRRYLTSWGQEIDEKVRLVPYTMLPGRREVPAGAYIFSDLERLGTVQRTLLNEVWTRLAELGDQVSLLNHPLRSLLRLELLTALHEQGLNTFRAFRPTEPGQPWRYPVFVRQEREHTGPCSALLDNENDLRHVLLKMLMDGFELSDLLVVEFCDTADETQLYRKYSSFRVGAQIIPRHILFSNKWMLKDFDLIDPSRRDEVQAYCRANPHEAELRRIFEMAQNDDGRIDYSLTADGRIQVWEINTNPIVMKPPEEYGELSLPFHRVFAERFMEAFSALDVNAPALSVPTPWLSWPVWER